MLQSMSATGTRAQGLQWLQAGESYVSPELLVNEVPLHEEEDEEDAAKTHLNSDSPWVRLWRDSRECFYNEQAGQYLLTRPVEGVRYEDEQDEDDFEESYTNACEQ